MLDSLFALAYAVFEELRKVRAPAMKATNMSDPLDRAGTYLWAMVQAHRVSDEFTKHQWREHPAVSGAINYHLFRHSATSSQHRLLQDEVDHKSEVSKLVSRVVRLESRNKGGNGGGGGAKKE